MRRHTLVAIIALLLDGCVGGGLSSGPQDNRDFYRISKSSELEGVFKNKGDNGNLNVYLFHPYLSENIWGWRDSNTENLPHGVHHKNIELIEVSSADNTLTVRAIQNSCVVYEKTYVIGQDFELKDGQLVIHKNTHLLIRHPNDLVLGPSYQEISLGIDTGKQGKARSTVYAAGLIYLVIPFVSVGAYNDVRYEKVSVKPQGFKACENR